MDTRIFLDKRGNEEARKSGMWSVLFSEKYLYIFHAMSFRVPLRHCRNYTDDDNDNGGGILLCHVLEHLSPFARFVTRVTSGKLIDSITSSI